MTCRTYHLTSKYQVSDVDFERYSYYELNFQEYEIVRTWFVQAWNLRDDFKEAKRHQYDFEHTWKPVQDYSRYFDAFHPLWNSFNNWASCVANVDTDRDYIEALINAKTKDAETIREDFLRLTSEPQSPTGFYARLFANFWPIYDVRSLRVSEYSRLIEPYAGTREEVIETYRNAYEAYRKANPKQSYRYEPQPLCWKEHEEKGESVPIDWAHTLRALYKVRCNLYHGSKLENSQVHQRVVYSAFHTLLHFLHSANYFGLDLELIRNPI